MSQLIETKAAAVAANLSKVKGFSGVANDFGFINIIIALLPLLLAMFQNCFPTAKAMHAQAQNLGPFRMMRLRAELRRNGVADDEHSIREIALAIEAVAKKTTEAEFAELVA